MTQSIVVRSIFTAAIFFVAIGFRLSGIDKNPWHPDEADVSEVTTCLVKGQRMSIGAISQNAFFPLSASPLSPMAAALAEKISGLEGLPGLRRWSAFLGAISLGLLAWILWGLISPGWGIVAGLVLASHPLAISLQQMGYYHHLGVLLSIACLAILHSYIRNPNRILAAGLGLICGLTVASAYWFMWILLLPILAAIWLKRPKDIIAAMVPMLVPLLAIAFWSYSIDPTGFWADIHELGGQAGGATEAGNILLRPFIGYFKAAQEYPSLYFALFGLLLWTWTERDKGRFSTGHITLYWAIACSAEVFRQRQNLEAFSYPLILVLVPMAIGLTALFVILARKVLAGKFGIRILPLALCIGALWAVFRPVSLHWIRLSSAPPFESEELVEKLKSLLQPGDMFLGQTNINWKFSGSSIHASDLEQAAMWEGDRGVFLRSGISEGRYVFAPKIEEAKVLVLSPFSFGFTFSKVGPCRLALRAEMQGWSKIWTNGIYEIYGNPAKGFPRAKQATAMMKYYNLYDQAGLDAVERKDWKAAIWALSIAKTSNAGDVEGRLNLLKQLTKNSNGSDK